MDEIPVNWEEMREDAQDALRVLDMVGKTPVPQTLRDAIDGKYFSASQGAVQAALGHVSGEELREWSTRVIPLKQANEILRQFESNLVKAFVLSSASPARIIIDAMIAIPKWIIRHAAEIAFILWPLFSSAIKRGLDVQDIEERIKRIDEELAEYRETLAELYAITPGQRIEYSPSSPAGTAYNAAQPQFWTAADILRTIKEVERRMGVLRREKEALEKLSARLGRILDLILLGVAVTLSYLAVEKLLLAAKSLADATVTFAPVRKLRDAAVEQAKAKSLPQWPQKRTRLDKRSRRN